jgi:hypothetical protein
MSTAGAPLDSFSAASLHCHVDPETYRSAVKLTGRAERVEMPAGRKTRLWSLRLGELRGGRS